MSLCYLLALVSAHVAAQSAVASTIPRVIHQTYHTPAQVPAKVAARWKRYAPGWPRHLYDDAACINILRSNFSAKYVSVFDKLKGAHRADLCRYAIMFLYGGVYADIKFKLLVPLDNIVQLSENASIRTVEAFNGEMLHQGFIIAVPRQVLFLKLMAHMQSTVLSGKKYEYQTFTRYMFVQIRTVNHHLFYEQCAEAGQQYLLRGIKPSIKGITGLDRYCRVCVIVNRPGDFRVLAKIRFDDYPWGKRATNCKWKTVWRALESVVAP